MLKLPKIIFILFFFIAINPQYFNDNIWKINSYSSNITSHFEKSISEYRLNGYKLNFFSEKDNHIHTFSLNDGTYLINATMKEVSYEHYNVDKQHLIIIKTITNFRGENNIIKGKIECVINYIDWGNTFTTVEKRVREINRKKVIDYLQNLIKKNN